MKKIISIRAFVVFVLVSALIATLGMFLFGFSFWMSFGITIGALLLVGLLTLFEK